MIAKCLAVLAVVAQINASSCGCGMNTVVVPIVESTPTVFVSSENSGSGDSGTVTRNLVGQGKYPVAFKNCGPRLDNRIPITTSHSTAALQEKPTVRLPACIPAPKVISHSCTCYKTILRPRIHQQIITVPSVQRFVQTSHKPVVENIQYEALPVNCGSSSSSTSSSSSSSSSSSEMQLFQTCSGSSSSGSIELVPVPRVQTIRLPPVQFQQVQPVQTIQIPEIQTVQIQQQQPSFGSCTCQC